MASRNQLAFKKRWWILPIVIAIALGGAYLGTSLAQRQYEATCRLFVAVAADTTPAETYQGSLLSQERVVAYLGLIQGDRVAQEAINSLGLNISASDLVKRIKATAEVKSVLINVSVTDSDSQRSADLSNAVCSVFQSVAADTEAPSPVVNVKLVEKADAPDAPISPNGPQNLAIGALAGVLVGCALILALDRIWPARQPSVGAAPSRGDAPPIHDDPDSYTDADAEIRASRHRQEETRPE